MMKEYTKPSVEFVEFEANIIASSGCNPYNCPNSYGGTCTGNPYGGS